jgi:hypothetical protein
LDAPLSNVGLPVTLSKYVANNWRKGGRIGGKQAIKGHDNKEK